MVQIHRNQALAVETGHAEVDVSSLKLKSEVCKKEYGRLKEELSLQQIKEDVPLGIGCMHIWCVIWFVCNMKFGWKLLSLP